MTSAVATAERERTVIPRHVGWGAIAVGVIAWYIALPPILVRSFVPSVVLGVMAIGAGAWVLGRGESRLGWGAIAAGVIGAGGAVASTRSGAGHLADVVTWSALFAAMLRFATPLLFGALGGIVSERSGVVNIGIEGMMLTGCYFGIYGADIGGSWVLGASGLPSGVDKKRIEDILRDNPLGQSDEQTPFGLIRVESKS